MASAMNEVNSKTEGKEPMEYFNIKPIRVTSNAQVTRKICLAMPRRCRENGNENIAFDDKKFYQFDWKRFDFQFDCKEWKILYSTKLGKLFEHARGECETFQEKYELDHMRQAVESKKQFDNDWDIPLLYISYHSRDDASVAKVLFSSRFYFSSFVKKIAENPQFIKNLASVEQNTNDLVLRESDDDDIAQVRGADLDSNAETYNGEEISSDINETESKAARSDNEDESEVESDDRSSGRTENIENFLEEKGLRKDNESNGSEPDVDEMKQGLEDSELDEPPESMVSVKIGKERALFDIESLRTLSYFQVALSSRWQNSVGKKRRSHFEVGLLGFGMKHLKILLECTKKGHIPYDLEPDLKNLEGLIECSHYLMSTLNINEDMLIEYFNNASPPVHCSHLEDLAQTKRAVLQNALKKYKRQKKNVLAQLRQNLISKHDNWNLSRVHFDPETANALFSATYQIVCRSNKGAPAAYAAAMSGYGGYGGSGRYSVYAHGAAAGYDPADHDNSKMEISITNFKTREAFKMLWEQCRFDSKLSTISWMPQLVRNVLRVQQLSVKEDVKRSLMSVIFSVLECCQSHTIDITVLEDVTEVSLMKTAFCLALHGARLTNLATSPLAKFVFRTSDKDFVELIDWFFTKASDWYKIHYKELSPQKDKEGGKSSFLKFVENVLLQLIDIDHKIVAKAAKTWFPMFHEANSKSSKWIMEQLVPRMSTQSADEFAAYLANYAACDLKAEDPFVVYLKFIERQLGIKWGVAGTVMRVD